MQFIGSLSSMLPTRLCFPGLPYRHPPVVAVSLLWPAAHPASFRRWRTPALAGLRLFLLCLPFNFSQRVLDLALPHQLERGRLAPLINLSHLISGGGPPTTSGGRLHGREQEPQPGGRQGVGHGTAALRLRVQTGGASDVIVAGMHLTDPKLGAPSSSALSACSLPPGFSGLGSDSQDRLSHFPVLPAASHLDFLLFTSLGWRLPLRPHMALQVVWAAIGCHSCTAAAGTHAVNLLLIPTRLLVLALGFAGFEAGHPGALRSSRPLPRRGELSGCALFLSAAAVLPCPPPCLLTLSTLAAAAAQPCQERLDSCLPPAPHPAPMQSCSLDAQPPVLPPLPPCSCCPARKCSSWLPRPTAC